MAHEVGTYILLVSILTIVSFGIGDIRRELKDIKAKLGIEDKR